MGKRVKLTKTEKILLAAIFILHVAVLYLVFDYSKAMETYPDELIYYNMARCIFEGKNLMVHGVDFQFSKLAYSFVLLPTFIIKDVIMRVHVIMMINAVLMSLSFIPCYLICRELNVERHYCWMAAILICLWPDIVISGTFMSENLFFPVTAFAFYYILLSYKYEKTKYTVMVLILSALAYFTKEIGICVLLAYIGAEILSAIITRKIGKNFKSILIFILVGGAAYLAIQMIFLGGISNSYISSGALDLSYFRDYHVILYLVYGFLYTLVGTVLAFWVLPVMLPIFENKKLDSIARKYLLYTVLLLLGSVLVIAVTITAREDFGKLVPGVHLRYLAGIIVPFISIFFAYLSLDDTLVNGKGPILMALLFMAFIFKGIYNTCTTGTIGLQYIYIIRKIVGSKNNLIDDKLTIYPAGIATVLCFAILTLIIFYAAKRHKEFSICIFFLGALLLSAVNIAIGYRNVYDTYVDDEQMIAEMLAIDAYFENNGLTDTNVAFVDESQFSEQTKVYDLYFKSANRLYMIPDEDLKNYDGVLVEPIINFAYIPGEIDYFIVTGEGEPFEDIMSGVTMIPELTGETYCVYRNNDPATMERKETY